MPYIDKDMLIQAAKKYGITLPSIMMNAVPDADVKEIKRGQWEEYSRSILPAPINRYEQAWKCTICSFDDGFPGYKYCPECGALMCAAREDD